MSAKTDNFISKLVPAVQAEIAKRGYGVCSAIIAQAAVESAWGESSLASTYNNYFGMKCGSYWTGRSVNMNTQEEYTAGTLTNITANFRVYDSFEAGIAGYFDFIEANRYAAVRAAKDYKTYIEELKKAGYATSSTYINTLISIVEGYNLTAYDNVENVQPAAQEAAPQVETSRVVASNPAQSLDKNIAGAYTTSSDLNLRDGAGTDKKVLVVVPKGTSVSNYGYYTVWDGVKWFYVLTNVNGVEYVGFVSSAYLNGANAAAEQVEEVVENVASGSVTASAPARAFDGAIAGTYRTTANLNMRDGAGTNQKILTTLPSGTTVHNYGYYTLSSGVKWLYVQVTIGATTYTGFVSGNYLTR